MVFSTALMCSWFERRPRPSPFSRVLMCCFDNVCLLQGSCGGWADFCNRCCVTQQTLQQPSAHSKHTRMYTHPQLLREPDRPRAEGRRARGERARSVSRAAARGGRQHSGSEAAAELAGVLDCNIARPELAVAGLRDGRAGAESAVVKRCTQVQPLRTAAACGRPGDGSRGFVARLPDCSVSCCAAGGSWAPGLGLSWAAEEQASRRNRDCWRRAASARSSRTHHPRPALVTFRSFAEFLPACFSWRGQRLTARGGLWPLNGRSRPVAKFVAPRPGLHRWRAPALHTLHWIGVTPTPSLSPDSAPPLPQGPHLRSPRVAAPPAAQQTWLRGATCSSECQ